jgi:hypothetical protein
MVIAFPVGSGLDGSRPRHRGGRACPAAVPCEDSRIDGGDRRGPHPMHSVGACQVVPQDPIDVFQ